MSKNTYKTHIINHKDKRDKNNTYIIKLIDKHSKNHMKLNLNYPKELYIFTLYQTPIHLNLACPQARNKDSMWKS